MSGIRIICPNCKRILGDTEKSLDCNLNCRGCKQVVHVKMVLANFKDYLSNNIARKEAK